MYNQKEFTPIIIALIVLVLVGAGGASYYLIDKNYRKEANQNQQQETEKPINDNTIGWKNYVNQDLGFSFDYPDETAREIKYTKNTNPSFNDCELITPKNSLAFLVDSCSSSEVDFSYYYLQPPFVASVSSEAPVCLAHFNVNVMGKPLSFSLEEIKNNLKMGEYTTVDKEKAVRRYEFIAMPPGGGGYEDVVYIIKDEKLYIVSFSLDRELIGNDDLRTCLQHQVGIFDQILSTFKFVKEEVSNNEMADWKTYRNEQLGIEIKYPSVGWEIKSESKTYVEFGDITDDPIATASFMVTTDERTLNQYMSYINKDSLCKLGSSSESIKKTGDLIVGGLSANKLMYCDEFHGVNSYKIFIRNSNKSYIIDYKSDNPIHQQMLSTFRFLK